MIDCPAGTASGPSKFEISRTPGAGTDDFARGDAAGGGDVAGGKGCSAPFGGCPGRRVVVHEVNPSTRTVTKIAER